MPPDGVIEPVDVSGDGVFGLLAGLPCDRPDQLRLDGLEERFHHRVVVAVPAPAHRDQDAAFAEQRLIVDRAVLRSAVGMVNQPGCRVASHQSTAQGFDREIAFQAVTRRPADDTAREEVQDDSEVEPALCRPDVGYVCPPFSVRRIRREVLGHQIGGDGPCVLTVRRPFEAPFLACNQLVLTHQAGCGMPPDLMAIVDEVAVHARAAIGAVRQREGRPDMRQIDHVLPPAQTSWPFLPRKEAVLADPKDVAHPVDREAGLLRFDEAEGHRLPSFAKKAAAFLRCRAPASEPHSPAAAASTRHGHRRVPHSARWHHVHLSPTESASTVQCPDPQRSPVASGHWSVPAAPLHAETPASVCSRFP